MLLNHPEADPTLLHGKTVFHETGPWGQNSWGLLLYICCFFLIYIHMIKFNL